MTFDSVVDGDLFVLETTRRNRNFKVIRKMSRSYFVKQVLRWEPQALATLQREAGCYWLVQNDPSLRALADLLPKCYAFDASKHILILELLQSGESLADFHRRTREFPTSYAEALAAALGSYHGGLGEDFATTQKPGLFPKNPPWILSVHQQQPAWLSALGAASSELLQVVKKYPEFPRRLDELREQWRYDSLIHGDMKWDNCIVQKVDGELRFKVVDWELADIGDSLWDVGAILQSYISDWILSMPTTEGMSAEQMLTKAARPLEEMQPSIQAFWDTYVKSLKIPRESRRDKLQRAVQYGAARMIQTAFEAMTYATQVSPGALYLLQASLNVLERPGEAIDQLFGIREG